MTFPSSFVEWMGASGIVLVGAVAIYGQVDKLMRARAKENGSADDRLINILKQTVEELSTKVNEQQRQIEGLNNKMEILQKENQTLTAVLQGRDAGTIEFQKNVLSRIETTRTICESTNANVERLCEVLEKHLTLLETN